VPECQLFQSLEIRKERRTRDDERDAGHRKNQRFTGRYVYSSGTLAHWHRMGARATSMGYGAAGGLPGITALKEVFTPITRSNWKTYQPFQEASEQNMKQNFSRKVATGDRPKMELLPAADLLSVYGSRKPFQELYSATGVTRFSAALAYYLKNAEGRICGDVMAFLPLKKRDRDCHLVNFSPRPKAIWTGPLLIISVLRVSVRGVPGFEIVKVTVAPTSKESLRGVLKSGCYGTILNFNGLPEISLPAIRQGNQLVMLEIKIGKGLKLIPVLPVLKNKN